MDFEESRLYKNFNKRKTSYPRSGNVITLSDLESFQIFVFIPLTQGDITVPQTFKMYQN